MANTTLSYKFKRIKLLYFMAAEGMKSWWGRGGEGTRASNAHDGRKKPRQQLNQLITLL